MSDMKVHITYPAARRSFWKRNAKSLWRSLFLLAGYICLLIDLLTGGSPWSLIVIGGLMVVWVIFFYQPQVENTLTKKFCDSALVICLFLFLLDGVVGGGWSGFVVPIVFFGDLILIGGFFLFSFHKRKRDFLPFFELLMIGMVSTLTALIGFRRLNWPMIVVGSVSLGLLVLTFALFWREITREIRKKFHV